MPTTHSPLRLTQVCIVLSTTYSARLPEKYTGWTDQMAEAVSIDMTAVFLPVQCVSFSLRLLAYTLSPVGVIALLLLAGVGLRVMRWHATSERPRLGDAVRRGILDLTPPGLVLIFCFVPSVSAFIFRAWSCKVSIRFISPLAVQYPPLKTLAADASGVRRGCGLDYVRQVHAAGRQREVRHHGARLDH